MRITNLIGFLVALPVAISLSSCILAQDAKPTPYRCQHYSSDPSDPVSSGLRGVLECYSGGFIALAEEIPAEKYASERRLGATVGHNVGHVAFISNFACSKMSGVVAPKTRRVKGEADKDGMVEWLKSSMEFCKKAFSSLSDDKLGESIAWSGFDPEGKEGIGQQVTLYGAASWFSMCLSNATLLSQITFSRMGLCLHSMQCHLCAPPNRRKNVTEAFRPPSNAVHLQSKVRGAYATSFRRSSELVGPHRTGRGGTNCRGGG
jgi:DinB superfamily